MPQRHLGALHAWPQWLAVDERGVQLIATHRDSALAVINAALRAQGLILAWRDETYAILTKLGDPPLALIERATARFWGTLTFGAHANGYVADAAGRPTHLWIARRALNKATDPGKLDNLVGGGVPHGQTPFEALVREGYEEAGLPAELMHRAVPGRVIDVACDIAEGFMHEQLHGFDLCLPADVVPVNQDGEVAELRCLPVEEAIGAGGRRCHDRRCVTGHARLRAAPRTADGWRATPPRPADAARLKPRRVRIAHSDNTSCGQSCLAARRNSQAGKPTCRHQDSC